MAAESCGRSPVSPRKAGLSRRCLIGVGSLGLLLPLRLAQASDFVTLRAWADPAYVVQKASLPAGAKETYVMAQGEYFAGDYRDPTISPASLGAIIDFLAPTLTKQGYYPAKDLTTADQLVIVHWGTTMGNVSDYVQTEANLNADQTQFRAHSPDAGLIMDSNALPVPGPLAMPADSSDEHYQNAFATEAAAATAHAMTTSSAEGLLGYGKQLTRERKKLVASDIQQILEANLHDDRYFVILQAYDFQKLRKGDGRKLLWSMHMSIRAPGLNFKLALPRMGQVAADLYGQSNDEVVMGKYEKVQHGSVEIGPLRVLSLGASTEQKK
jgi:hypothetical protein